MSNDYNSLDDLPPIPPERRLIFQRELSSYVEPVRGRPKLTVIRGGKDKPLLIEKVTEQK